MLTAIATFKPSRIRPISRKSSPIRRSDIPLASIS